jgi:hypothetical protein
VNTDQFLIYSCRCAPKPLGCLAFIKNLFAPTAGSSPRESGSLLV